MLFKARSKGGATKNLIKLKDGDSVIGVFRGEIHTFYQHWANGRSIPCTRSEGTCSPCNQGGEAAKASYRFRVNFVTSENGSLVAKVFEGGGKVYDQLNTLDKEYGLEKFRVKITRSGTDKNTTYAILPVKDGALSPEGLKQIEAVGLNNVSGGEDEEEDDVA